MASRLPDDRPGGVAPSYAPASGMVARIRSLLLTPRVEWARIDAEPMTAAQVFRGWAVPLAAIGPVASFVGQQIFGFSFLGIHYRPPLIGSLTTAVLSYLGALIGVWVLAAIIDGLAPSFNAVKNRDQAMKVAAFSYTAAWVAGVLTILPMLGVIALLLSLYSFYLLWVGLPMLMKPPADKAATYVVVSVVLSIVIYIAVGALIGAVTATMMRPAYDGGSVTLGSVTGPNGASVNLDKLAAAGQQMAAAAEVSAAQAKAAQTAAAPAAGKLVAPAQLQAMLPAAIAGFTRTTLETSGGSAAGVGGSTAKGTYTQGDQSFELSVSDVGALGQLATLGGALNLNSSKQTATGYEKTVMQNGAMTEERWDNADHHGKYSTMVASRFAVAAEGSAPSIEPLKSAVAAIDTGQLAALAR